MSVIPVLRTTAFRPVVERLRRMGVPVEAYLEEVGVPIEALQKQDRLVPERTFWAMLENIRQCEGIPDIGFRLGSDFHVTEIEDVASHLSGHPTLIRTMEAFCALLRSHNNTWDYWIEVSDRGTLFCRRGSAIDIGQWPVEQYVVSYLVDVVRLAAPASWWPSEIWLQSDVELQPVERDWLGDATLHFGSPCTAILVPDELISRRPKSVRADPVAAFETEPISKQYDEVVRELIRTRLVSGQPRLEDLEMTAGFSPRTLQRRLAEAGTSFQILLDDVRTELACTRLEESRKAISEIATDLGYARVAAFSKSFRRWTGVSPSEYRKANQVVT